MALTLLEMKKTVQDPLTRAVIDEFAEGDLMRTIPFESITGSGVFYNQVEALPGVAFRGINESYTEGTGVINPQSDALKICGGDLDVDVALVRMGGAQVRSVHERLKVKNIRLTWERTFIKGDSATNPREFDGLQKRVTGGQLLDNAAGAGGALSLARLDALISQVEGATALIMSRVMRDRLTAASRSTSVGGFITFEQDAFGRKVAFYGGLPILIDSISNPILPFTEASPDASVTTNSSIYCVSFGDQALTGIQNGVIQTRDLNEVPDKPVYRTRVEWLNGFAIYNGYSVARLRGITNAAVVV